MIHNVHAAKTLTALPTSHKPCSEPIRIHLISLSSLLFRNIGFPLTPTIRPFGVVFHELIKFRDKLLQVTEGENASVLEVLRASPVGEDDVGWNEFLSRVVRLVETLNCRVRDAVLVPETENGCQFWTTTTTTTTTAG